MIELSMFHAPASPRMGRDWHVTLLDISFKSHAEKNADFEHPTERDYLWNLKNKNSWKFMIHSWYFMTKHLREA